MIFEASQEIFEQYISVYIGFDKAVKRICGRSTYDSNDECLEHARLLIVNNFPARKVYLFCSKISNSKRRVL